MKYLTRWASGQYSGNYESHNKYKCNTRPTLPTGLSFLPLMVNRKIVRDAIMIAKFILIKAVQRPGGKLMGPFWVGAAPGLTWLNEQSAGCIPALTPPPGQVPLCSAQPEQLP